MFVKFVQALALWVLLTAGVAVAAEGVHLVAQPDIGPGHAALPRVVPREPQAARINQALAAADARSRIAAGACRSDIGSAAAGGQTAGHEVEPGRTFGWTRRIAVAMSGPRYLALVSSDYADCGSLYPDADNIALTYDLQTGRLLNWSVLLPKRLVETVKVERAMDETPIGMVDSPALRSLYLAAVEEAATTISPDCMEALKQMAGPFMLWPDAKRGGLMVQPARLPHGSAACGVPALIETAMLKQHGVKPALLDAIAAAHRTAINQVPRR